MGTWRKQRNTAYWLACFQWLAKLAFLQNIGPPLQGWHCGQWPRPSHICHYLRKCLKDLPTGQFLSWGSPMQLLVSNKALSFDAIMLPHFALCCLFPYLLIRKPSLCPTSWVSFFMFSWHKFKNACHKFKYWIIWFIFVYCIKWWFIFTFLLSRI